MSSPNRVNKLINCFSRLDLYFLGTKYRMPIDTMCMNLFDYEMNNVRLGEYPNNNSFVNENATEVRDKYF